MRTQISINGLIEANLNNVDFNREFVEWIESKNWLFTGITKDEDEESE
ncbi:hypothetical protein ACIQ1D_19210 [Lysinibacillus xylanilyticus]